MITFLLSIVFLLAGYFLYARLVEKIFGIQPDRVTPAYSMQDGVDYVPMGWAKIFLIQFLNIAGLGPIFGAILGAMYGPIAFVWIVVGNILGGAVHDFLSGMISLRNNGLSLPEIVGKYLGNGIKQFMRGFSVALMILVGAVFILGPAGLLNGLMPGIDTWIWAILILVYYVMATLLPIDKLIGRIYPIFGFALLFMAVGIFVGIFVGGYEIPELFGNFRNLHRDADSLSVFPMMFVTIACGAVSGFHATQSPLMARCIKNERNGRRVFYGAMVAEGIVALIWAAAAMAFFGGVNGLNSAMTEHKDSAAWAVNLISTEMLGPIGAFLAVLGVVAAPITTGDTAFRSARLIVADFLEIEQKSIRKRVFVSLPLFAIGFILTQVNFDIIWRYMSWSNQTLSVFVFWAITVYLVRAKKFFWITLIPAIFMTMVCSTYIMVAPEGLKLDITLSYLIGAACTIIIIVIFVLSVFKNRNAIDEIESK